MGPFVRSTLIWPRATTKGAASPLRPQRRRDFRETATVLRFDVEKIFVAIAVHVCATIAAFNPKVITFFQYAVLPSLSTTLFCT